MVNPRAYRYVLDDKILLPIFCRNEENVRIPRTVATYCNGVYFDSRHKTMTIKDLSSYLRDFGELVLKPTQDTSSGRGVRLVIFRGEYDCR